MTKQVDETNVNVIDIQPDNLINSGIMWGSMGSDYVPLYEEHSIRLKKNFTMDKWYELPEMERAMIIAVERIEIASRNINEDAQIKAAKQNAKKGT